MADTSVLFATVGELGRLLRARKISSVEVTKLALEALATQGRELHAVAELISEVALRQARNADRELREGNARGPLHGIPYGAKDLLATKGIPTRWGSPAHRRQVFDYDATVIERLREAGAVLVGKLAMIELAGGGGYCAAEASMTGACGNPYNPTRWAGGSSSGSGTAVGGGMVGFAVGTETYGSIICPSAFCNVSGLRPTYGRVPRYGAMALSWTLDKIGPMARAAEDCGFILAAIAGYDARDAASSRETFRYQPRADTTRKFRLGILPVQYRKHKAAVAKQRFAEALRVFHRLGHRTASATLPKFPYETAVRVIIGVESAAAFENLIRSQRIHQLVDEEQQAGLLASLDISGVDYLRALRVRTLAASKAVQVFEEFDALIAPTFLHGAPPLADISKNEKLFGGNGGPGDLLGWPSLSIPMGPDEQGLPLGLELIGAPYQEATLLALGRAFQRETEWHRWRPGEEVL